jgi:hypothetical protein
MRNATISQDEAQLLVASYLPERTQGFGFATVAEQLGLSQAAVRQRCSRASRKLTEAVRPSSTPPHRSPSSTRLSAPDLTPLLASKRAGPHPRIILGEGRLLAWARGRLPLVDHLGLTHRDVRRVVKSIGIVPVWPMPAQFTVQYDVADTV